MAKIRTMLVLLPLLAGVAGCGETPSALLRDILVFWNEVCDNTLRVKDNKSAAELYKAQFKMLAKKHEKIKERAMKTLGEMDKDGAKELETAYVDYFLEIQATKKRLKECQDRLENLIKTSPETERDKIEAIKNWLEEKQDFQNVRLGKYDPTPGDPKMPKQFGGNFLFKRPQFERTQAAPK